MADEERALGATDWFEAVYDVVRALPSGRVATYGQVADRVSGYSVTARQVGTALSYAPADLPWHRVVGAGGYLPVAKRSPELMLRQRDLLAREGVGFTSADGKRVDMQKYQVEAATCAG